MTDPAVSIAVEVADILASFPLGVMVAMGNEYLWLAVGVRYSSKV